MITEEECFLDDDSWRNLRIESSLFPLMPESSEHFEEGLNHFAAIPGLLKRAKLISQGCSSGLIEVLSDAQKLRENLINWVGHLNLASRQTRNASIILSLGLGSVTKQFIYKDMMTASFTVNYCAYLIRLNSAVDSLHKVPMYAEDNVKLALCICMSTEYCSHGGFCGTQTLYAALPLARSVLPAQYSPWISEWIAKIEGISSSLKLQTHLLENT
jgi:hypothetical protein